MRPKRSARVAQNKGAEHGPDLAGGQCQTKGAGFRMEEVCDLGQRHPCDGQIEAVEEHDQEAKAAHEILVCGKSTRVKNFRYAY